MAIVAVDFTHFDRSHKKGDVLDDDDLGHGELIKGAPHLFVQPTPLPETEPHPVRIRGPLVDKSSTSRKR